MTENRDKNPNIIDNYIPTEIVAKLEVAQNTAQWMLSKGLAKDMYEAYKQIATERDFSNFLKSHFSSVEEAYAALFPTSEVLDE